MTLEAVIFDWGGTLTPWITFDDIFGTRQAGMRTVLRRTVTSPMFEGPPLKGRDPS